MSKYYGIYNTKRKEFQFGICETSKRKAEDVLFKKIGKDAYKWRFVVKELKQGNPKADKLLSKVLKNTTKRCPNYTGVTCVNGSCPNAMADEYPEYGYEHCSCDYCGYYKGCEDCCFVREDGNCDIDKKLEETHGSTTNINLS